MLRLTAILLSLALISAAEALTIDDAIFSHTPRTEDVSSMTIPRFTAPPTIDGDLSDACWSDAAKADAFWELGKTNLATDQTIAWVGFDGDHLYVAYACKDKHLAGDGMYERDSKHIWMGDSVEVHLAPSRDAKKTYQFILGIGGGQYDRDTSLADSKDQVAWNPDWTGAVKKQPFGYTAEMRIPLDAVLDRSQFDVDRGTWWRIKLTRSDFSGSTQCTPSSWTRMGNSTDDAYSLGELYFEDRNLVINGSAEQIDDNGAPVGWDTSHQGMTLTMGTSTDDPTDGKRCAQFDLRGPSPQGANSRIYAGPVAPMRSPVETTYRFSADIKVDSEPQALTSYYVVFNGKEVAMVKFDHNKGWQHVQALVTVEAGKSTAIPAVQSVPSRHLSAEQNPGGIVTIDNVRFEPIEVSEFGGDPDAVCLTGNAFGAYRTRNQRIEGSYSYFEPGTTGHQFPNYLRDETAPEVKEYEGWIPFDQGILTDGETSTFVRWSMFWTGAYGHDITFDLGGEYLITRVAVLGQRVPHGSLHLKRDGEAIWMLTDTNISLYDFDTNQVVEGDEQKLSLTGRAQPARWVRVNIQNKFPIPAEVQIWGKPLSGETPKRQPYLQNGGKTPIAQPANRPVVYKDIPPIFPIPQEAEYTDDALKLRDGMTIAWHTSGGDRARITAEVLAEEMKTCFNLSMKLKEGATGDITLGESTDAPDKPDGYNLTVDGKHAAIEGHDARGTFYGTQSLLTLVRRGDDSWELPGATIHDWPDMPVRYIQGRPIPEKNLIRALARFRVTHYEAHPRYTPQAAQWDKEAARYFVDFVPHLAFNQIVLTRDASLTEHAPEESLDSLGYGRRNANPAHPKSWELYLAEVDKWLPQFHGNLVHINYDETYQTSGGARWNVSPESRALNLSAGDLIAWQINRINDAFKKYGKTIAMHDTAFMSNLSLSYIGDPDPSWNNAIPKLPRDVKFLVWHPETAGPRLHDAGFELYELPLDERDWREQDLPGLFKGIVAYMGESAFTPAKLINQIGVTWNLGAPRPRDPWATTVTTSYIPLWNELHLGTKKPSRYATAKDMRPIDISKAANRSRVDDEAYDGQGFVDLGANVDMRALPAGRMELAGVPFDVMDEKANAGRSIVMVQNPADASQVMPQDVTIPIKPTRAASLLFLHQLENRPGWNYLRRKELAGYYIMEYDDGTYGHKEIKYSVNTANWDGRPVNSGYNPKGHAMTDGFLAWEGDSTSGLPVFLYATEWVNPRPDKTIVAIHLRSARNLGNMNPMLYAVTAVDPRLASPQDVKPEMPSMQRLAGAQPTGTQYDLSGGTDESETRYVAPDGTIISTPSISNTQADKIRWDGIRFRSWVSMVNADGNYSDVRASMVQYDFPKPVAITGALVSPAIRMERKTENFDPAYCDLALDVSTDGGTTWQTTATAQRVNLEEQGPTWLATGDAPVTNLRVNLTVTEGYIEGFNHIKLYRR